MLLFEPCPLLKEAHQTTLKLTNIFNRHQSRKAALTQVNRWIISVQNNETSCFKGFIKTLERYKSGILNYFKSRKNSGFVEGLNNKIKVLKRRCYGLSKIESIFRRLFLDLQGYRVFAWKSPEIRKSHLNIFQSIQDVLHRQTAHLFPT